MILGVTCILTLSPDLKTLSHVLGFKTIFSVDTYVKSRGELLFPLKLLFFHWMLMSKELSDGILIYVFYCLKFIFGFEKVSL